MEKLTPMQVTDALPQTLPALTLWEPWAWLLFHGKDIENRNWATKIRGPVAIHAASSRHPDEYAYAQALCRKLRIPLPPMDALPYGAVLGIVDIVHVVTQSNSPWFSGPYGFVIANPREFNTPVPARGGRLFWKWKVAA